MSTSLVVVFDNESVSEDLETGWGFSCLVQSKGRSILFDTGCDGPALLKNMKILGIEDLNLDGIFLSHQHWDHTGGLFDILDQQNDLDVFIPASFSARMTEEIGRKARVVKIDGPKMISEGIWSTGDLPGPVNEQAMIVMTKRGGIVITGCAHPGLEIILETARQTVPIYGLLGGFHGHSKMETLEELELLGPCHCSEHKEQIRDRYPEKTITFSAGTKLNPEFD